MEAEARIESTVYDTFILGEDKRCHVSTDCHKTQLNNNIMVVGGSGSGKTRSVMVPILLHLEHSNAIGIFTKWGMLSSIRKVLEKRGYKVHVLNLSEPDKSEYSFDPLVYCKTDEDIRDLAQQSYIAILRTVETGTHIGKLRRQTCWNSFFGW